MASIQRLTSPLTGRISFRVQVRLRGNPSQSATFRNRKDAERWASSIESAILERRHFPHTRANRTTFESLAQRYREHVLAETGPSRRSTAERHLAWWLGRFRGLSLAEVTPDRVAEARDALAAEGFTRARHPETTGRGSIAPRVYRRSGATVNRYLATLSHLFTTAVREWRLIDRNPVRDITKKKESRGRSRFLSDPEREALLRACAKSAWPPLEALVLLAISTGARRGELIRLRWTDLNLSAPCPQALIPDSKNGDPRRLPLVGRALRAVTALSTANGARSPFVFPSRVDPERPYVGFDAHWYAALGSAGIEDFRFHDLRHTCASYLASQGSSLLEIADVLGHRTMAMVKRYSHLAQDHKVEVIRKMTRLRGL
ncbi:MAG: site-specific integrase [Proteobacteria bacterium]|nr:site-specific integrase [Pseudomonadota bacterium]